MPASSAALAESSARLRAPAEAGAQHNRVKLAFSSTG